MIKWEINPGEGLAPRDSYTEDIRDVSVTAPEGEEVHDLTCGLKPEPAKKSSTSMSSRSVEKSAAGSASKAAFGEDRRHDGTFDGIETELGKEGLGKDMN